MPKLRRLTDYMGKTTQYLISVPKDIVSRKGWKEKDNLEWIEEPRTGMLMLTSRDELVARATSTMPIFNRDNGRMSERKNEKVIKNV